VRILYRRDRTIVVFYREEYNDIIIYIHIYLGGNNKKIKKETSPN